MRYDAIIVGGSYAGLSAALALVRARKRVLIIDAGQRRNRFAHTAHGFLGQDGRAPDAIARDARAEVADYPTVTFLDGSAIAAALGDDGFTVTVEGGATHTAARLILATGIVDELPDLPGLREGWGKGVLHCPYCHGYEVAGRRLGVLAFSPLATHLANLIPEWGPTTFLTNGAVALSAPERAALAARGVTVEDGAVAAVLNAGEGLAGVRLHDGRTVALDALFIAVPWRQVSPLAAQLGCALDDTALGPVIRVDATGRTSVPGVYAAGDVATMMKSLPAATASGYLAGAAAHQSLLPPAH
ncbi:MAG: NAD(P)/FAD-dependent oxidoreductase [Chloroflexota bacterium]|nr:NAD(P)/FAD-dependent oxidoreductase [Chloroflexota bacterium]